MNKRGEWEGSELGIQCVGHITEMATGCLRESAASQSRINSNMCLIFVTYKNKKVRYFSCDAFLNHQSEDFHRNRQQSCLWPHILRNHRHLANQYTLYVFDCKQPAYVRKVLLSLSYFFDLLRRSRTQCTVQTQLFRTPTPYQHLFPRQSKNCGIESSCSPGLSKALQSFKLRTTTSKRRYAKKTRSSTTSASRLRTTTSTTESYSTSSGPQLDRTAPCDRPRKL